MNKYCSIQIFEIIYKVDIVYFIKVIMSICRCIHYIFVYVVYIVIFYIILEKLYISGIYEGLGGMGEEEKRRL